MEERGNVPGKRPREGAATEDGRRVEATCVDIRHGMLSFDNMWARMIQRDWAITGLKKQGGHGEQGERGALGKLPASNLPHGSSVMVSKSPVYIMCGETGHDRSALGGWRSVSEALVRGGVCPHPHTRDRWGRGRGTRGMSDSIEFHLIKMKDSTNIRYEIKL